MNPIRQIALKKFLLCIFPICLLSFFAPNISLAAGKNLGGVGSFRKWEKIEIEFKGYPAKSIGDPNPFSEMVDVEFVSPDKRRFLVPAYYDGDGEGDPNGNIWAVRFSADTVGLWRFRSISNNAELHGYKGFFEVIEGIDAAVGFFGFGILEYPGNSKNGLRYFKFRDGPFWLKAGCDNPENFLGKSPNFDTEEKRKAAVDFLSERGINSIYILTHNIGGDFRDVWPWLGNTEKEAKLNAGRNARFDIVRLREWQELFEYMQKKEVVPYLILEDDSAWTGYDYKRYYREIVARFAYLPALVVNLGEEFRENHRLMDGLARARFFRSIDPFDHPLGIHDINTPEQVYLNANVFDYASIQTKGEDSFAHNSIAIRWLKESKRFGSRIPMIGFDEPRPELNRQGWWAAYLGGAVWQLHAVKPFDAPHSTREPAWTQLGGARRFIETLPYWEMEPDNSVISLGKGFCLKKEEEIYALYLPEGTKICLDLPQNQKAYKLEWWNPENGRNGNFLPGGYISSERSCMKPPNSRDWAARLTIIK